MLAAPYSTPIAAALLAGLGITLLLVRRRTLVGTTLMAPWWWAVVALICVVATEAMVTQTERSTLTLSLRYVAATSAFCPLMAVLGAKRPQDRMWQFIVLSLWAVLAEPAAEWWLFESGGPAELHPVRLAFLGILLVVAFVNYLPTRFCLAGGCYALATCAILAPFLSHWPWQIGRDRAVLIALALANLGLLLSWIPPAKRTDPLDRLWIDFRDHYGAVWALRVAQRVNAAALAEGAPVVLRWSRFVTDGTQATETARRAAARSFLSLLRRFVSPAWIERHLGQSPKRFDEQG